MHIMDRSWAQRAFQRQIVFDLGIDPLEYHGALAGKRSDLGCLTGLNRGTDGSREKHQQKSTGLSLVDGPIVQLCRGSQYPERSYGCLLWASLS